MIKLRVLLLATAATALAACGGEPAPQMDDALRNDLSLAATVRAMPGQQFVGPNELNPYGQMPPQGYAPYGYAPQGYPPQAYAPQGYYPQPAYQPVYAPAPAPRPAATVRRTSSAGRSTGSYGTASGPVYKSGRIIQKNTKRDAAIGAVAGAAIGVATSARDDRLKGGLIGAVAGAALGAVIGNNVDVKRTP